MVENNRVEFKEKLNDTLEKEVVAFLNYSEGGYIYIGIDNWGKPKKMENIDSLQLKIINRIKDSILSSTLGLFDVVIEEINGISVIKIIVSSGPEKPYYIKRYGMSPNGCSAPRNKTIMRIFKDVDWVEQLGSGMKRILKFYKTSIFDIKDNFLIVTFPFNAKNIQDDSVNDSVNNILTAYEKKVLKLLKNNNHLTASLLSEKTGISIPQINRIYKSLKLKGYIKRIGTDKKGYWQVLK